MESLPLAIDEMIETIGKVIREAKKDFEKVFTECMFKYALRYPEKGDSWKRMTFEELHRCFKSEEWEFYQEFNKEDPDLIMVEGELKDMILCLMMMFERVGK